MMKRDYDIIISGAGPVGLTAALAARTALGKGCRILVCAPDGLRAAGSIRTYAISTGPMRLLTNIGVWAKLKEPQAIRRMNITDSRLEDIVRQSFLQFEGLQEEAPLASMVTHMDLLSALRQETETAGIDFRGDAVASFGGGPASAHIELASGATLTAGLVVACDGAGSQLRDLARIATTGWNYKRDAIVATVEAEEDHHGAAIQHFLPAGTFALLPLPARRLSIVWVERPEDACRICSLHASEFTAELQSRAGNEFGRLRLLEGPQRFPLKLQIARRFTSNRLVLIGDAAHTMHPLAGQGLNLGLEDIGYLMEALLSQVLLGFDIGSSQGLRTYEKSRWAQTTRMLALTDGLFRLFTASPMPVRHFRDAGLGLLDGLPRLKDFMITEASGNTNGTPRLLRAYI